MPTSPIPILLQQAAHEFQAGRLAQTESLCRQILAADPRQPDALHLLGLVAFHAGKFPLAFDLMKNALALRPAWPEALNNMGTVSRYLGKLEEALSAHHQALALAPEQPEILLELGSTLKEQGNLEAAIALYRRSAAARPTYAAAFSNLGMSLLELGQIDQAIDACRQALQLQANNPETHTNLGLALRAKGQRAQAIECHRTALNLRPNYAGALMNLANVLIEDEQLEQAKVCCQQILQLHPNSLDAHLCLGNLARDEGDIDEALALYRKAQACGPHSAAASSNLLLTMHYLPSQTPEMILAEAKNWDRLHGQPLKQQWQPHTNDRSPNRRLRIGYVSTDFRKQSCAFFLHPLLANHDHQQFEIFCYAQNRHTDTMTQALQKTADHWVATAGMPDDALVRQIRADRIDILVDLMGHTGQNRLPVFAQKPAPIQMNYLGYPSTTGMQSIDYRFTDAHTDPPGITDPLHTEKLLRLPGSFLCFEPLPGSPPVNALPALTTGRVTLASLNDLAKISDIAVAIWANILHRLPQARFLIKSWQMSQEVSRHKLLRRFVAVGIAPERIEFFGRVPSIEEHMAFAHEIDLSLDPYPYHGTTTSCESLWMGVPFVTLAGPTHVSRVGVSLLHSVGLEECVADTPEEYVEKAVNLAQNLPKLASLRAQLRERMKNSPLMDGHAIARNVEAAYRRMWHMWCE